jgi:hypothetical protein
VDNESDPYRCQNPGKVQIMEISLDSLRPGRPDQNEFFYKLLKTEEEYRIKLVKSEETDKDFEQSVKEFGVKVKAEKDRVNGALSSSPSVSSKQAQGISGEKVKIKSNVLGRERLTDANASVVITDEDSSDTDYPEYTLSINGKKIRFALNKDSGFEYDVANDKTIHGMCYRLYKFTDMRGGSKPIEIYVQVSPKEGSIFHTLQPYLATDPYFDISNICGD